MFFYNEDSSEILANFVPTNWSEIEKLVADEREQNDDFGESIAVSSDGNVLAVGVRYDHSDGIADAGSVYLFTRSGSTWIQAQKITASDKQAGDQFGTSVSVSSDGDIVVVGAPREEATSSRDQGSVYIFTRSGSAWIQTQKLTASDRAIDDLFGQSVSISADGNVLAVGAHQEDPGSTSNAGSVYLFARSGSTWTQIQKLSGDLTAGSFFGYSTSLSYNGEILAIGAYGESGGAAYIFTRSGATWTRLQKLVGSDTTLSDDSTLSDDFGKSLSLSSDGNVLAVGAPLEDPASVTSAGSVYLFTRSESTWTEAQKLVASDASQYDHFGNSVSLSSDGNVLAVGAYLEDPAVISGAGSVYLFTRSDSSWTQTQKVSASDKQNSDTFGWAVSVSSDGAILAASARGNPGALRYGAVYVFQGQ